MRRVLVTGANGFVGRHLCRRLAEEGMTVRAVVRKATALEGVDDVRAVGDLAAQAMATAWPRLLDGVDAVVHLAALTHAGGLDDPGAWRRYETANVCVTHALAAAAAGVDAFVMLSSIKVIGERSPRVDGDWRRLAAGDTPRPEDNYGRSKLLAEQAMGTLGRATRATVLRPPLLYGAGVKGNLLRLIDAVARGVPLPLRSIDNRRSLLGVHNLADAVATALRSAPPGLAVYTLADIEISTPDLARAVGRALGVAPRLWPCPVPLLRAAGHLTRRAGTVSRLTDSLLVDQAAIHAGLGWHPPVSFEQGIAMTAAWYRALGT